MSKEELFDQGWNLVYSGPCEIEAWALWMVHLRHGLGRMVTGYGNDEITALVDASETIKKYTGTNNEVSH